VIRAGCEGGGVEAEQKRRGRALLRSRRGKKTTSQKRQIKRKGYVGRGHTRDKGDSKRFAIKRLKRSGRINCEKREARKEEKKEDTKSGGEGGGGERGLIWAVVQK